MTRRRRMHVVIAGGGVGPLEALLALRALAGDLVGVTVLSPTSECPALDPSPPTPARTRSRSEITLQTPHRGSSCEIR